MASEPRSPGIEAGLDNSAKAFRAPGLPIGRAEAARRVREKIKADAIRCERLAISDEAVHRGLLINMARTRVPFPEGEPYESCYVALVDPCADAQWAHPAFWAFVPAAGDGSVVLMPTLLPEHALGAVRLRRVPLS